MIRWILPSGQFGLQLFEALKNIWLARGMGLTYQWTFWGRFFPIKNRRATPDVNMNRDARRSETDSIFAVCLSLRDSRVVPLVRASKLGRKQGEIRGEWRWIRAWFRRACEEGGGRLDVRVQNKYLHN
jgi:hypothetical protein